MTSQEFSDQFDILWNNINSNQAPGLNDYEKSVFLTKAQDEILKGYFNPRLNKVQEGYDDNEKRQIDFSMVMATKVINTFTDALLDPRDNNKRAVIPSNVMMFVNEFLEVTRKGRSKNVRLVTVPLTYKELTTMANKPYKRPPQYQAWRIIDNVAHVNQVELIPGANDTIVNYTIRYVKKPYPIIISLLEDEGVSIEGMTLPYSDYIGTTTTTAKIVSGAGAITDCIEQHGDGYYFNARALSDEVMDDYFGPILDETEYIYNEEDDVWYKIISKTTDTAWVIYPVTDASSLAEAYKTKTSLGQYLYSIAFDAPASDQGCELDPILHEEILQRAVEIAKVTWEGTAQGQYTLGSASATNLGVMGAGASDGSSRRQQQ